MKTFSTYKLLDIIFRLPPKEKRRELRGTFLQRYFLPKNLPTSREDFYILYQMQMCGFIFCGIILLLLSFMFFFKGNLYFSIDNSVEFYRTEHFILRFSHIITSVLSFIILPFFLFKLRWNFNPQKHTLPFYSSLNKSRGSMLLIAFTLIAIAGFVFTTLLTIDGLPEQGIFNRLYEEHYLSFLFFSLLLTGGLMAFLQIIAISFLVLCKYWNPPQEK